MSEEYVIGIDFGTDSVRAVVVRASDGWEAGSAVSWYPRWKKGLFCDPDANLFRQHPRDYLESMTEALNNALDTCPSGVRSLVKAVGVDTTGSTPVAVDRSGTPLSLLPGMEENPNAMFVLWKDHTAVREAEEINNLCRNGETDYTKYTGGVYSSEWFWAKLLHILRSDPDVSRNAHSWAEHCDWIPFVLTGGTDVSAMKRSRCAAGHKALWHPDFGGLPPESFLVQLDPRLKGLRENLFTSTFTSDQPAGVLSPDWAKTLDLPESVVVAVGAFDAHMGAVGGEIEPYHLSKVMGTSTCDMLVAPSEETDGTIVKGICGQVDGSVIPGMLGLEAGQSAFGDVFAWLRDVLFWSIENVVGKSDLLSDELKNSLLEEAMDRIIPELSSAAEKVDPGASGLLALDWLNGRRTPDANQELRGVLSGLNLGSDAPKIFRALVEATCFGARAIVERFQDEGVKIEGIIGLGGVSKKAPFVMQTMADVLDRPIRIARSEQTCALGAAMFAATAADIYSDVSKAMRKMGAGFDAEYHPDHERASVYSELYEQYCLLASNMESFQLKPEPAL